MLAIIITGIVTGIIGFVIGTQYTKKTIERELLKVLENYK